MGNWACWSELLKQYEDTIVPDPGPKFPAEEFCHANQTSLNKSATFLIIFVRLRKLTAVIVFYSDNICNHKAGNS